MEEYQFQYTKTTGTLIVLLVCFIVFIITIGVGVYLKLQEVLIFIIAPIVIILLYKFLKKNTYSYCVAKISDTKVDFNFDNGLRTINFDDIISFKAYYGNNGTVLYLKNGVDNFKLYANNFCDRKSFDTFCQDIITQLDKYKTTNNTDIIHQGSIFATRGMFYFLIIATLIYLLGFFFDTQELKLYIGLGGGFYLLIMWIAFFNKRDLKSK